MSYIELAVTISFSFVTVFLLIFIFVNNTESQGKMAIVCFIGFSLHVLCTLFLWYNFLCIWGNMEPCKSCACINCQESCKNAWFRYRLLHLTTCMRVWFDLLIMEFHSKAKHNPIMRIFGPWFWNFTEFWKFWSSKHMFY